MLFIVVGNSEIGGHIWDKFGNLLVVRHGLDVQRRSKFDFFLNTCTTISDLPSNICTMTYNVGVENYFHINRWVLFCRVADPDPGNNVSKNNNINL